MFYYFYETKNLANDKIYVGVHKTSNLEDGYLGSGKVLKQAIAKHGKQCFTKTILQFFENSHDMFLFEKDYVTEEFLQRPDVYNLRRGGYGGFEHINRLGLSRTPEVIARRIESRRKNYVGTQKFLDDRARRRKINHTEETKDKLSKFRKIHLANNEHPRGMLGKKHTDDVKKRISDTCKEKAPLLGKKGAEHPAHGLLWYNNGTTDVRAKKHPGNGWEVGRAYKPRKKRK